MKVYHLDRAEIMKYLPHRDPFLMLDEVTSITSKNGFTDFKNDREKTGIQVTAWKNISSDEPWVRGHFPGKPIFPGVLLLETMAQAAALALYPYLEGDIASLARDFQVILCGIDGARFRRQVIPGDRVRIEIEVKRVRSPVWVFTSKAWVGDQLAAEAEILANLHFREVKS